MILGVNPSGVRVVTASTRSAIASAVDFLPVDHWGT